MNRQLKTYSSYTGKDVPSSSKITFDLGGLQLNDKHLNEVRAEAVRAAMIAAASLLKSNASLDGFATFSTFSTFSTFGSGSFRELPSELAKVIDAVVNAEPRLESLGYKK